MNRTITRVVGGAATGALLIALGTGTALAVGNGPGSESHGQCQSQGQELHQCDPGGQRGEHKKGRDPQGGSQQARAGGQQGGHANGGGAGDLAGLPSGTLTDAQTSTMALMAEEEKLAHDVYTAFATAYPNEQRFSTIAQSETRHLEAVRALLTRYSLADPTAGKGPGEFSSPDVQKLYDDFVAQGTTLDAALAVGVTIEETDIADLTSAQQGLDAPDAVQVYSSLLKGSQNHLAAFSR